MSDLYFLISLDQIFSHDFHTFVEFFDACVFVFPSVPVFPIFLANGITGENAKHVELCHCQDLLARLPELPGAVDSDDPRDPRDPRHQGGSGSLFVLNWFSWDG